MRADVRRNLEGVVESWYWCSWHVGADGRPVPEYVGWIRTIGGNVFFSAECVVSGSVSKGACVCFDLVISDINYARNVRVIP